MTILPPAQEIQKMAVAPYRPRSGSSSRPMSRDGPPPRETVAAPPRTNGSRRNEPSRSSKQPEMQPLPQAAPYKLGQSARPSDIIRFDSISHAHEILPTLPIGTPLFVKRSNRDWTYARIVSYRRPDSADMTGDVDLGEEYWNAGKESFIVVALDEDYSMRKFIQKEKWYSCVRLVRMGGAGDAVEEKYSRHNSQHDQQKYSRRNSQPDQYRPDSSRLITRSCSALISSSDASRTGTAATFPVRGGNHCRPERDPASLVRSDSNSKIPSSKSLSYHPRWSSLPETFIAKEHLASLPKSKHEMTYRNTESTSATISPPSRPSDTVNKTELRRSKSGPGSRGSNDLSQRTTSSSINQQLGPIPKSKSTPSLLALESKTTGKVEAASTTGITAEEDKTITDNNAQVSSIATRHSFPTLCGITNSPGSSTSSSSSPQGAAIDLGPAKVNLNARHFCGKRRYRMRPQPRRNSVL
ncbi:hypothetical protein ACHAWO_002620 [Cyclotella atomus]|uniref:Uncharacterized protein n=1 Tax=Cyclotella atomus TaxID=382360 RepID=A0ABD3NKW9_9STRA